MITSGRCVCEETFDLFNNQFLKQIEKQVTDAINIFEHTISDGVLHCNNLAPRRLNSKHSREIE